MKRAVLSVLGVIALISPSQAGEHRGVPGPIGGSLLMAAYSWSKEERTFHGLTFPEMVEDAVFYGSNDHEATAPGYGYSARYFRPGWEMTVYIYDHGLSVIPNDVESGPMREEFEDSKKAIEIRGAELRREFVASLGGPKFLCASYTLRTASGEEVETLLSVTTFKNKFVKFRVSGQRSDMSNIEAQEFVAAWAPILWPDIVPVSPRDDLK
jgi:hypothetical protein